MSQCHEGLMVLTWRYLGFIRVVWLLFGDILGFDRVLRSLWVGLVLSLVLGSYVIAIWGVPQIRGPSLGVLIIRIIVYWGRFWLPYFWKLPYGPLIGHSVFECVQTGVLDLGDANVACCFNKHRLRRWSATGHHGICPPR